MTEVARRDVFQAIADPTRRRIIDLISKETMSLNAIAENFEISRPAVSQQIKILQECGIIEIENKGRERFCKVNAQNLIPAFLWLERFHKEWEVRLDNFENFVLQLKSEKNQKP